MIAHKSLAIANNKLDGYFLGDFEAQSRKSSSPNNSIHKIHNLTQLKNLECQESKNFGEIGDSIINKAENSSHHKNSGSRHFVSLKNVDFDQSEYDALAMNEKYFPKSSSNLRKSKIGKVFEFPKYFEPLSVNLLKTPEAEQKEILDAESSLKLYNSKSSKKVQKNKSLHAVLPES